MWKYVKIVLVVLLGFGLIQLIPYGRSHDNPPVVTEPAWSSPEIRALAQRACFDCHSNETVWPWYSQVAPVSWLVQADVENGRYALNFSDWIPLKPLTEGARRGGAGALMGSIVQAGEMPPAIYVVMHPNTNLSTAERAQMAAGFVKMFDTIQK
jgi:hypothetical protein